MRSAQGLPAELLLLLPVARAAPLVYVYGAGRDAGPKLLALASWPASRLRAGQARRCAYVEYVLGE